MLDSKQRLTDETLLLGDYVTVHLPGIDEGHAQIGASGDVLEHHEEFFQRILRQRCDLHGAQQKSGSVINVAEKQRELLQDLLLKTSAG